MRWISIFFLCQRINRYMLGCKYGRNLKRTASIRELIDTCWDVNELLCVSEALTDAGINRYMLGCKSPFSARVAGSIPGINRYMLGCKLV